MKVSLREGARHFARCWFPLAMRNGADIASPQFTTTRKAGAV
jgi:hypothetical protein